METMTIFGIQFVLSILVVSLVARWFVAPWLTTQPIRIGLMLLLVPHAFRHLGLVFVVPTFVTSGLDPTFAAGAAYGDLAAGLLAILAMLLLRAEWSLAIPMVWVFTLVGTSDLINALRRADVVPELGIAFLIPTFVVPVLLVTHAMIFARLLSLALPSVGSRQRPSEQAKEARGSS